jgi:hypothetical protein
MPVVPYNALIAQPPTTQLNLRQMIGEVRFWNPDMPVEMIRRSLADVYRRVIDERNWSGMLVSGQVTCPNTYTTGTVSVANGSNSVQGTGTSWGVNFVGLQFRIGFTTPIVTITAVDPVNQILTISLPWGGPPITSGGYQIFKNLVTFGPRIKSLWAVVNQVQGFKLNLHVPQEVLNTSDTWRTATGWTFCVSDRELSPIGWPQYELYPIPTFQQGFPFLAWIQPPDLVNDGDYPYGFIRSDIIVLGATAEALVFRGKQSKYYDPVTAAMKLRQFREEVDKSAKVDNDLIQKDLRWEWSRFPQQQMGSAFWQSHDPTSM